MRSAQQHTGPARPSHLDALPLIICCRTRRLHHLLLPGALPARAESRAAFFLFPHTSRLGVAGGWHFAAAIRCAPEQASAATVHSRSAFLLEHDMTCQVSFRCRDLAGKAHMW